MFPFDTQHQFLADYAETTASLVRLIGFGNEIKYGPLLNQEDHNFLPQTDTVCSNLLRRFGDIEGAEIIRIKAIKKKIRKTGAGLRAALFRKTLECCEVLIPKNSSAIILHDELDDRSVQRHMLETFNDFNKRCDGQSKFQNCVFVHSNENPFIQFADFIAAVCHRHNFYGPGQHKNKSKCAVLAHNLFDEIDKKYSRIVELSDITDDKDNERKTQAIQLAKEHEIDPSTAYNIVDGIITLEEVLRKKEARQRNREAGRLAAAHNLSKGTAYQIVDKKIALDEVLRKKQATQRQKEKP